VLGVFFPARPMRPTSDAPVASPAPVFGGGVHAFAWALPGERCRGRFPHRRVTDNGFVNPERLLIDRGHFALAWLSPRLGTGALRAASKA
jgi:hypothetical protein